MTVENGPTWNGTGRVGAENSTTHESWASASAVSMQLPADGRCPLLIVSDCRRKMSWRRTPGLGALSLSGGLGGPCAFPPPAGHDCLPLGCAREPAASRPKPQPLLNWTCT